MQWTKPDFKEITLGGEVTMYVNTDDKVRPTERRVPQDEKIAGEKSPS